MSINPLLGSNYRFDSDSGNIVSAQHQRIAEIIHDYNPELELMWIPPGKRDAQDTKPFVVVHRQKDGNVYPIFYVGEHEMDHRVLARIFAADMSRNDPNKILTEIEANEAAQEILKAKKYEDEMAEKRDFAKHLLQTNKNYYRHNGKVYK